MLLSGGQIPFPAKNTKELYSKVLKGDWDFQPAEAWGEVSDNAKDFVRKVLVHNVEQRLDYDQILEHKWFTERLFTGPNRVSVNFDALKLFNARRKVLKCVKAKQSALRFKKLMQDLERKSFKKPNKNLDRYLESVKLDNFDVTAQLAKETAEESKEIPQPVKSQPSGPGSESLSESDSEDRPKHLEKTEDDPEHTKASNMKKEYLRNMNKVQNVEDFLKLTESEKKRNAAHLNTLKNKDGMAPPPIPGRSPTITDEDKKAWKNSTYFKDYDHFI